MITVDTNKVLASTIQGEETAFKIAATGKAFKILSSNLYKNKIKSIVRELVCNAVDSHVSANHKREVIISLPHKKNMEFSVEDFGVGLSDDEVKEIYTTYFSSTKTATNELIGGFGLGSKTPFSYTDAFNVRSRKDGIENLYVCTINDNGMPVVTKLMTTNTTESNGVKVTVPVIDDDDVLNFRYAIYQLFWLDMPFRIECGEETFNINGFDNNARLERIAELKRNNYFLGKNTEVTRAYFVIGGIDYHITHDVIKSYPTLEKLQVPLYINVPIGTLDLTAGREDISMDAVTQKRVDEILSKYDSIIADLLDPKHFKNKSVLEYLRFMRQYVNVNSLISSFCKPLLELNYAYVHGNYAKSKSGIRNATDSKLHEIDCSILELLVNYADQQILFVSRKNVPMARTLSKFGLSYNKWFNETYPKHVIILGDNEVKRAWDKLVNFSTRIAYDEFVENVKAELTPNKVKKIEKTEIRIGEKIVDISQFDPKTTFVISLNEWRDYEKAKPQMCNILSCLEYNKKIKILRITKSQIAKCNDIGIKHLNDFDFKVLDKSVYDELFVKSKVGGINVFATQNFVYDTLTAKMKEMGNTQAYDFLKDKNDYKTSDLFKVFQFFADEEMRKRIKSLTTNNYRHSDDVRMMNILEANDCLTRTRYDAVSDIIDFCTNLLQKHDNCDKLRIIFAGIYLNDDTLINIGANYGD